MSNRIIQVAHMGTGGERGRILSTHGIATSLTSTDYKDPQKIIVEYKRKYEKIETNTNMPPDTG